MTANLPRNELERALAVACEAADAARAEIQPRYRRVPVETKEDGSPVTEADRAAERVIREVIRREFPEHAILGEEGGAEGATDSRYRWVIDPIDGTVAFTRGIPLYSTLIALQQDGESVVGLIDLPGIEERFTGVRGGGCLCNGERVRVSTESDLRRAMIAHGDAYCFDLAGQRPLFERMARELPVLRGYTDAFGHSLVLSGAVDAMVDLELNLWDCAPSALLVKEAGGEFRTRTLPDGKFGVVLGSPALVRELESWFAPESA